MNRMPMIRICMPMIIYCMPMVGKYMPMIRICMPMIRGIHRARAPQLMRGQLCRQGLPPNRSLCEHESWWGTDARKLVGY